MHKMHNARKNDPNTFFAFRMFKRPQRKNTLSRLVGPVDQSRTFRFRPNYALNLSFTYSLSPHNRLISKYNRLASLFFYASQYFFNRQLFYVEQNAQQRIFVVTQH
jgi:hypothetical protein